MEFTFSRTADAFNEISEKRPGQVNPFISPECVLKTCCKKYKKGKRCKKCPN